MGGLARGPLLIKRGALGADLTWKKSAIFEYLFEKGGLWKAQAEQAGSSGADQAEKLGSFGAPKAEKLGSFGMPWAKKMGVFTVLV